MRALTKNMLSKNAIAAQDFAVGVALEVHNTRLKRGDQTHLNEE